MRQTRATILAAAGDAVRDREGHYGSPAQNFAAIARMWRCHMASRFGADVDLKPEDVAVMLALMKMSRLGFDPSHVDSWVDVAGYAALGGEVSGKDKP